MGLSLGVCRDGCNSVVLRQDAGLSGCGRFGRCRDYGRGCNYNHIYVNNVVVDIGVRVLVDILNYVLNVNDRWTSVERWNPSLNGSLNVCSR